MSNLHINTETLTQYRAYLADMEKKPGDHRQVSAGHPHLPDMDGRGYLVVQGESHRL